MTNAFRKRLALFSAIVIITITIAVPFTACSQDTSPSLKELTGMADSIEMTDIQSYRSRWSGSGTSEGEASESYREVSFTAPDWYHVKDEENSTVSEFISIGDTQYINNSESSSALMIASINSISGFFTPQYSLDLLEMLVKPKPLPPETVNGVECFHYSGTVDMESQWKANLASLDPSHPGYQDMVESMEQELERIRETTTEYTIWIGREDLLLRKMEYSEQMPSKVDGQKDTANITVEFYDINKPVTIEPPLDEQGELLPGWQLSEDYSRGTN
jgi:outer membrane lipoprotein-sorting protein